MKTVLLSTLKMCEVVISLSTLKQLFVALVGTLSQWRWTTLPYEYNFINLKLKEMEQTSYFCMFMRPYC